MDFSPFHSLNTPPRDNPIYRHLFVPTMLHHPNKTLICGRMSTENADAFTRTHSPGACDEGQQQHQQKHFPLFSLFVRARTAARRIVPLYSASQILYPLLPSSFDPFFVLTKAPFLPTESAFSHDLERETSPHPPIPQEIRSFVDSSLFSCASSCVRRQRWTKLFVSIFICTRLSALCF